MASALSSAISKLMLKHERETLMEIYQQTYRAHALCLIIFNAGLPIPIQTPFSHALLHNYGLILDGEAG